MKQNYIYLIILLTISHRAFSMETAKELVGWFEINEGMAKALEDNQFAALYFYGMLVDKPIPLSTSSPDPYAKARKIQNEAYNKISSKGNELEKEKKYENALKIYKFAPLTFASQITHLEKILPLEKQKQESDAKIRNLVKWFKAHEQIAKNHDPDNKLEGKNWKNMGSLQALFYYGRLVDEPIPAHSPPDPYKEARKIQNEAYNKISSKGDKLEKEKNYEDALLVYNSAPITFALRIEKMKQEEQKLEQEKKESQQKKFQTLKSWVNSAETFELMGDTNRALDLYNAVISTNLPESPELASLKQKANERIKFLKVKPILEKTQKLINEENYLGALDEINKIRVENSTQEVIDIKASIKKKLRDIEEKLGLRPKQPTQEEEKKEQEKLEREQLAAERLRQEQERLETERRKLEEQLKQKKLEQEKLTNKSLQQLLQTLIQLIIKLKLLADYITSHAPL